MGDYSEFVVILDRSGSMQDARSDHEGGLNSFVADQRTLAGDVRFTFIRFDTDSPCEVVYDGVPIEEVGKCELIPRGGTPLLDAVGRGIGHVAARLDGAAKKPDQVVVMIITDGQENSSREWTRSQVKALVEEREKQHGWRFLFLGANVDAFAEGGGLGVAAATSYGYSNTRRGVAAMYSNVSGTTLAARSRLHDGADEATVAAAFDWSESMRAEAMGGDEDPGTTAGANPAPPTPKAGKKGPSK